MGSNIFDLLRDLEAAESSKRLFQSMNEEWEQDIKNANLFTKLFKKDDLKMWGQNIKDCEEDIKEYDLKIKDLTQEIDGLGFGTEEIKKMRDYLSGYVPSPESHYPWVGLLGEQEQDALLVDYVTDKKGAYSALMDLTDYIDAFKTDVEKLDFVHGFHPDFKAEGKLTDAYKLGDLFCNAGFSYGIDLDTALMDYAPQYRHDLTFVSLVSDLSYEQARLDMAVLSSAEELIETTEKRIDVLQEKIGSYEFFGKIDFLAGGPGLKTIVGETLYYDNYKDYIKEVRESRDCGRPIHASDLTLEKNIKEQNNEIKKPTLINHAEREEFVKKLSVSCPERAEAFISGVRVIDVNEATKLEALISVREITPQLKQHSLLAHRSM